MHQICQFAMIFASPVNGYSSRMRRKLLPLLVLLLTNAWLCAISAHAQFPVSNIIQVQSSRFPGCGTGVLVRPNSLLVSRHLVTTLCPQEECSTLRLARAPAVGRVASVELEFATAELLLSVPTIDFAIIKLDGLNAQIDDLQINSPDDGAPVTVLGFPQCTALTQSAGQIKNLNSLHLVTSAWGDYGSSGSAVLNSQGELVGLADQASSVIGGLSGSISGSGFKLRAIRADIVQSFFALEARSSCEAEATHLLQYYHSNVQGENVSLRGLARVRAGLDYITMADSLSHCAAVYDYAPSITQTLLHRGDYLIYLANLSFDANSTQFAQKLELVIAAYNRELKGLYGTATRPLNVSALLERIKPTRSADQYAALTKILNGDSSNRAPYVGLQMFALSWGSVAILFFLVALILWAATGSYIFATAKGSWLRRLLVASAVLILFWPVSLLYVWGARLRARWRGVKG